MTETWDRIADWAHAHVEQLAEEYGGVKLRHGRCPCPIHGGKNLNFSVKNGEGWFCHSGDCGGGDGVGLVARLTNRDRLDVLRELAPRAGVFLDTSAPAPRRGVKRPPVIAPSAPRMKPAPPPPWWEVECEALRAGGMTIASSAEMYTLMFAALTLGPMGRTYLEKRGFDPEDAHTYGFRSVEDAAGWRFIESVLASNYLPAERESGGIAELPRAFPIVLIPYRSLEGRAVIGFNGRVLTNDRDKRYRKAGNAKLTLPFNAPALDGLTDAHTLHIVEGEMNAYTLHAYGERAVSFGAAKPSAEMLEVLAQLAPSVCAAGRVVLWFDDDKAGENGFGAVCGVLAPHIRKAPHPVGVVRQRIPKVPDVKDVNDLHLAGVLADVLKNIPWPTKSA